MLIRKTAHFVEFFVLGSLLYWRCGGRPPRWRLRLAGWQCSWQRRTPSPTSCAKRSSRPDIVVLDSVTDTVGAASVRW